MTSINNRFRMAAFILATGLCASCSHYKDALTPEEALQSFKLSDDRLAVSVFAAEPQVLDPVEMVFDEDGNVFVVEMPDYPAKPEDGSLGGAIRMLTDTNGDGRMDSATVFADHLSEATSILPWQGGLLVTAAPNILFLKDTTGDHRADIKEILFTGFFADNSEAQITNLRFSVDNWIYASNTGREGEIRFTRNPNAKPVSVKGGDFRFRLDRGQFEIESSSGQFGLAIDDWGNRFFTENSMHVQQAPIPARYLYRHKHLPSVEPTLNISDHDPIMFQETPAPYWRQERTKRRNQQFEEAKLSDRHEYADDHFTGASGGTFYGGDALPKDYYGSIFTGEVAGNLIHRDVLKRLPNSPKFAAQRSNGEKEHEFLASTDPWFRPANFTVGPDGSLYVIDMYRQHIETPTAIPEDLKEDMDFMNGSKLGRIYRIAAKTSKPAVIQPKLRSKTSAELVALLAHPNQWWRLQAQRLLLEKQDKSVIPALKDLFTKNTDARARLHAFFVLEGLNALDVSLVNQAMQDAQPAIRAYGLMMAERFPTSLPQIIEKASDPSAPVAFQAGLSLGQFPAQQVAPALAGILGKYGKDSWFRTAVLSSEAGSSLELVHQLVGNSGYFKSITPEKDTLLTDLAFVIGSRNRKDEAVQCATLFDNQPHWQQIALTGLTNGLKAAGVPVDARLKRMADAKSVAVK
ncbi:dehydrogenase [Spirosoma sp. KCTC 42546]|uniref:PVC-type heme-binding CxxCH protein n=1 Tax=Spirosoma sp. KCTC 42546 TaxID=2520506 RepID=UPI0011585ECB|nr:PVC-type heme-binding CxxCH protein [Spirosoma sp. KCTC 42546]QDK81642.1 dehydrogenase [Spirosoma sp. KCTC 42546]